MSSMPMGCVPLRLVPGDDLRGAVERAFAGQGAAYVLQGIGSLSGAMLRFAGRADADALAGDLEILTLAGSVSPDGAHLHMTVADAQGRVFGGHVAPGCRVRTTAELVVAVLPGYAFGRAFDAATGYPELTIRPAGEAPV